MEIDFLELGSGKIPISEFIESLNDESRRKIEDVLGVVSRNSISQCLQSGLIKKLKPYEIYEIKIKDYRLLGGINGSTIFLSHAFRKKSRRIPIREIKLAERRLKEKNII